MYRIGGWIARSRVGLALKDLCQKWCKRKLLKLEVSSSEGFGACGLRVPGRGFAGLNQHQARRNALLWHGWVVLCLAPVGQNLSDDSRELAGPGTRGSIWFM